MRKNSTGNYTFIDLFAGCGGLSEGFYRKGFTAFAHVEINKFACDTLRERMRSYGYANPEKEVVEHDITAADIINRIDDAVGGGAEDVYRQGRERQPRQSRERADHLPPRPGAEDDRDAFVRHVQEQAGDRRHVRHEPGAGVTTLPLGVPLARALAGGYAVPSAPSLRASLFGAS